MVAWAPFSSHRIAAGWGEQQRSNVCCVSATPHHQGVHHGCLSLAAGDASAARHPRQGTGRFGQVHTKVSTPFWFQRLQFCAQRTTRPTPVEAGSSTDGEDLILEKDGKAEETPTLWKPR
jgi:hypothetical protein